jgi:photosystem I subunit 4
LTYIFEFLSETHRSNRYAEKLSGFCFERDFPRLTEERYNPQDNPGTETTIPTTEEGSTPLDERYRMTGQEAGTEVSPGAQPEAPGGSVKVVGGPNQGTDSR